MTRWHDAILESLDTIGGLYTGDVARKVEAKLGKFGSNGHQHSGAVRSWLIDLENKNLVRRLDDQKPVCWVKV